MLTSNPLWWIGNLSTFLRDEYAFSWPARLITQFQKLEAKFNYFENGKQVEQGFIYPS